MKRAAIPTPSNPQRKSRSPQLALIAGVVAFLVLAIVLAVAIAPSSSSTTNLQRAQRQLANLVSQTKTIASTFHTKIDACKNVNCLYTVANTALTNEGAVAAKIVQSDFPSATTTPLDNYLDVVEALQKTYLGISEDGSFSQLPSQLSSWSTQVTTVESEGPQVQRLLG